MRTGNKTGLLSFAIALITTVFLSGCVAPFSPHNTGVNFINDKPYAIPYSATYFLNNVGSVEVCGNSHSTVWVEESTYQKLQQQRQIADDQAMQQLNNQLQQQNQIQQLNRTLRG